jgi:hypothetical protein
VYQIWKTRCQVQHGLTKDEQHKRALLQLTPQVKSLYTTKQDLAGSELHIFQTPEDELLSKPIATIKAWIHTASLRIKCLKAARKARKRQEKTKHLRIHPFFISPRRQQQHLEKPRPTRTFKKSSQSPPRSQSFLPKYADPNLRLYIMICSLRDCL